MAREKRRKKNEASGGGGEQQEQDIFRFVPGPSDVEDLERSVEEECRERILTGELEELLLALQSEWDIAAAVLDELVASNDPHWARISSGLESRLTSIFTEQSQTLKERAPAELAERERVASVAIKIAYALVVIAPDYRAKSEFLDSVLSVWGALRYEVHREVLSVLQYFAPLEVMAKLIAIMQAVYSREGSEKGDYYETIDALISRWSGSDGRSDSIKTAFSLYATFFSSLFSVEPPAKEQKKYVDEVKRLVFAKVEARAKALGGGLDLIVRELTEEGGVAPSCVYISAISYSRLLQNRIRAIECLGEHGEVSTLQPLPKEVQEIRAALYSAGEEGNPARVQQAAQKALARYIVRGKEAAKLASSPKSPVPSGLTTLSDLRDTSPVVRMDAPGAAAGPGSRALSPDPNLSYEEDVDLARSAFVPVIRRPGEAILTHLEEMQKRLAELHVPVGEELLSALQGLYELKSLGSFTENARAAAMVYRVAKSCGMDLTYKGERVALSCIDRKDYKAGVFRLRTFSGKQQFRYDKKDFPPLDLALSPDPVK